MGTLLEIARRAQAQQARPEQTRRKPVELVWIEAMVEEARAGVLPVEPVALRDGERVVRDPNAATLALWEDMLVAKRARGASSRPRRSARTSWTCWTGDGSGATSGTTPNVTG
jgi:hypothetical protein